MCLLNAQLEGFAAGYNNVSAPQERLPLLAFLTLNAIGDILDLSSALYPKARPDLDRMTPAQRERLVAGLGHCSALVRVTGDYSDLLMSHSSWFTYSAMLRIYKHYALNLQAR